MKECCSAILRENFIWFEAASFTKRFPLNSAQLKGAMISENTC